MGNPKSPIPWFPCTSTPFLDAVNPTATSQCPNFLHLFYSVSCWDTLFFFSPQPSRPSPVSRVTQEGRSPSGWAPMETCCHMELEPYSFQFFLVSPSPAAELLDPSRLACPPLSIFRNTMYPAQSLKEEMCDPFAMASRGMMSVP